MKKFCLIFAVCLMFFAVSCGGSQKAENDADNDILPDNSVDENTDSVNNENEDDDNERSDDIENTSDQSNSQYQNDEDQEESSDTTEAESEDIDSTSNNQTQYNSPYGSISFDFSGYIDSHDYPWNRSGFLFSGTYGNGSTPIPEDPDVFLNYAYTTDSDLYSDDIRDKYIFIQRVDKYYTDPVFSFYIPIEIASKEGVYNINYDYKNNVSFLIFNIKDVTGECIHAFAEGEIEITKSFIEGEYELSFRGDAKLYNPLNYKGNDISTKPSVSDFFIKFTETDKICAPID